MIIPKTIDQAKERLGSIGELLTAKEWERAAIAAAFVRFDRGNGRRGEEVGSSAHFSARSFAALGIHGMRSHRTVGNYVQSWLDAHEGVYPEPGARIEIVYGQGTDADGEPYDGIVGTDGKVYRFPTRSGGVQWADIAEKPAATIVEKLTPSQKIEVAAEILQEATTNEDRSALQEIQERAEIHSVTTKEEFKTVVRAEKEREAATKPLTGLSPLDRVKAFALVELGQDAESWGGLLAWTQERVAEFAVDGAIREARR